ncbi:MAG: hypothetical protein ABIG39_07490 [Candidatus Micrarchaeota archaeon]
MFRGDMKSQPGNHKSSGPHRTNFRQIRPISKVMTPYAKELEQVFKVLPKLDLEKFVDGCMNGFNRKLSEGEEKLASSLKEHGLYKVSNNSPEYGQVSQAKDNILSWLRMVQKACNKHPNLWVDYAKRGKEDSEYKYIFSDLLKDVASEYATIVQEYKRPFQKLIITGGDEEKPRAEVIMENAKGRMLHLYENDHTVWCCVEGEIHNQWTLEIDYPERKIKP